MHDVPRKYKGKQCITTFDGTDIPLLYQSALFVLPARLPTQYELDTLTPIELTSPTPWQPHMTEVDDDEEHDLTNMTNLVTFPVVDGGPALLNATTKDNNPDWDHLQKCLGFKPMEICEKTMKATTQLAKNHLRLPLREHYKSRFPGLNVKRLNETFATDTFFSSEKALGGYTCAQIFVGKSSYLTEVFAMHRESSMSDTLSDFIRKWGAPYALLSDNAKSETSKAVKEILRKYNIKDLQTEAYHPNQNLAERRIQEVKKTVNMIMDRVGAPNHLWYECIKYVTYLLNRLAHVRLNNRTPYKAATGETPDISALLQFHFYQPVYYYDKSSSFPKTKEKLGWWMGVAENVGDALTYRVLTTEEQIICRSVLRPGDDEKHPNHRINEGQEAPLASEVDHLDQSRLRLPTIDPNQIMGKQFIKNVHGNPHKAKVIEELEEGKYLVKIGDGEREEILTYNEILDYIDTKENEEDNENMFIFESILDHRIGKDKKYEILVKWETGEETWEPLNWMVKEDPITVAEYGQEQGLLNEA